MPIHIISLLSESVTQTTVIANMLVAANEYYKILQKMDFHHCSEHPRITLVQ